MAVKSTLSLLVLVVILAELPHSFSFRFTGYPNKPLVVYYKNRTNVELRWDWDLETSVLSTLKIKRYRKDKVLKTETRLAYFPSANSVDQTKYSLNVVNQKNGYVSFVIKDITNQGNNKDSTPVKVMEENVVYVYKIEIDVQPEGREYTDEVQLKMLRVPYIKTYPRNQTVSGGTVTFECVADGKPKPTITWDKIGSSQSFSSGNTLTISSFDASKIGVYRCTAKSTGIAQNASATAFVQFSSCGSGCTEEEFGIEFTDLEYNYEYENPSYNKYKELKNKVETECLAAYAKKGKTIHKCELKKYRKGSVVAVVELGYPTNTANPKEPLQQAINDGSFAGYKVKTDFVSPTSPPTEKPPTTLSTAKTSSVETPGSGARTSESGLSKGAIIALVVVFSIIFIVIIVVLIVCMLKRKKTSDTGKPYKDDERTYDKPATTVPLKSQPFDPMYDDPNEDRYPNGGGPPPQYTPSSNYAEVRPNQQDDSQVEWDKSVKDEMWI